jgi:hypothetical protein
LRVLAEFLKVMTPSGNVGFARIEAVLPISSEQSVLRETARRLEDRRISRAASRTPDPCKAGSLLGGELAIDSDYILAIVSTRRRTLVTPRLSHDGAPPTWECALRRPCGSYIGPLLTCETGTLALCLSFLGLLAGFAADCFRGYRRT